MQTRIQKWGDSLAVRIPKPLAVEIGLDQDTLVEVTISEGRLLIEPVLKPKYSLEELLAGVTDDNIHQEIDITPP